jgi:hypothetical protein
MTSKLSHLEATPGLFLVVSVLVHEFGHAFQSKLRHHEIKEPAVLWLHLDLRQLIIVGLLVASYSNTADIGMVFAAITHAIFVHPYMALFIVGYGVRVVTDYLTAPPVPIVGLFALAVLLMRWHPTGRIWQWKIKLPLGVGMHITHRYRDWSDIVAGVTCESALWLVLGYFLYPVMLWMVPLTILVNIVIPFKLHGEGNDAVCLWRKQFARMRGFTGITEV